MVHCGESEFECTTTISAGSAPCLQATAPPHPNIHPPQLSASIPRLLYLCNQIYQILKLSFGKSFSNVSPSSHFPILTPVSRSAIFGGGEVATTLQLLLPSKSNPSNTPLSSPPQAIPLHACLWVPIIPVTVRTADP